MSEKSVSKVRSRTSLQVTLYPHSRTDSHIVGHYLYISGAFPLGLNNSVRPIQFLGAHKSLCITLGYPPNVRSLLEVAHDIKSLSPFGSVEWFGAVRNLKTPKRTAILLYISSRVWAPKDRRFAERIVLPAVAYSIRSAANREYFLLTIPSITRDDIYAGIGIQ